MRRYWLVILVVLCGCDADRFLSGQWTSTAAVELELLGISDSGGQKVNIELNLGHYGQDVVGVSRFVGTEVHNFETLGCQPVNDLPVCPCNRIDGTYKSSSGKFYFELKSCSGVDFRTVLHENGDLLEGTIEIASQEIDIEFEQTASEGELTSSDKSCDSCE